MPGLKLRKDTQFLTKHLEHSFITRLNVDVNRDEIEKWGNKKVLLRQRKRHTARRVAVASACYSRGGTRRWGTPQSKVGVPPPSKAGSGPPPPGPS